MMEKAKVFISCGQKEDSTERDIAERLRMKLEALGFDPYLAFEKHSISGLRKHIFEQISDSEYFLFIDFKRHRLAGENKYRGSLYTNQELAFAAFLEKDAIGLQHKDILKRDGMLSSMFLNTILFDDSQIDQLPDMVEAQVSQNMRTSSWKNKLLISVKQSYDDVLKTNGNIGRHYYLKIDNLHKDKIAKRLYSIKEAAVYLGRSEWAVREMIWAGSFLY